MSFCLKMWHIFLRNHLNKSDHKIFPQNNKKRFLFAYFQLNFIKFWWTLAFDWHLTTIHHRADFSFSLRKKARFALGMRLVHDTLNSPDKEVLMIIFLKYPLSFLRCYLYAVCKLLPYPNKHPIGVPKLGTQRFPETLFRV